MATWKVATVMFAGCAITGFSTVVLAMTVKNFVLLCPPAVAVTEPVKVPEEVGGPRRRFAVRVIPFWELGETVTHGGPVHVNVIASASGSVALIPRLAVEGEHPP